MAGLEEVVMQDRAWVSGLRSVLKDAGRTHEILCNAGLHSDLNLGDFFNL